VRWEFCGFPVLSLHAANEHDSSEQRVCLHGSMLGPKALGAVSSHVDRKGLVGTRVLTWIGEKLLGLMCDFEHYPRHCSLGEEAFDPVAPVRAGKSSERSCCSTCLGSWRALMESSLRCSLPLAYVLD
jgi:hypothetical protein